MIHDAPDEWIVFYDGGCGFCSELVRSLQKRSFRRPVRWIPLKSEEAKGLLGNRYESLIAEDSVILKRQGSLLLRSEAILTLLGEAKGPIRGLRSLKVLPTALLDQAYQWVAKNRPRR